MAWRAEHNRVSESLANAKREYEKRKRSELRKEQERERMERLRLEEQAEQKRLKAKAEEERKEKEHRKRESKRMDEDAAVAVRTKALGKDRFLRTYWWGIGGVKGAVYVEDLKGNWGVLTARREVDALVDALHVWGVREKALKQNLHRRIHTIHAEFRKRAREEDEELPGAEASGGANEPLRRLGRRARGRIRAARRDATVRRDALRRGGDGGGAPLRRHRGAHGRVAVARDPRDAAPVPDPPRVCPGRCSRSRRRCTTCR